MKRTPLRRGRPPRRKTRLRSINPTRKPKMTAKNFTGPYLDQGYNHAEVVVSLGCGASSVGGCRGPIDPAHLKRRTRGGDWRSLVGLCRYEHHWMLDEECANDPDRFKERTGVDLAAQARLLAAEAERRFSR